jgi:hypothetical protein
METIFAATMVLICSQEPDSNYLALFRSKGSGGERGRNATKRSHGQVTSKEKSTSKPIPYRRIRS